MYTYIDTGRRCYVYFSLKPDDVKNERGKQAGADIITKNKSYIDILFTHGIIICYMQRISFGKSLGREYLTFSIRRIFEITSFLPSERIYNY